MEEELGWKSLEVRRKIDVEQLYRALQGKDAWKEINEVITGYIT